MRVMVFTPTLNKLYPNDSKVKSLLTILATPQLSVAVGLVQPTKLEQLLFNALMVKLAGKFTITGFSVSVTVMVCVQLEVLLLASFAVHVMVVTPKGYGALSAAASLRTPETVTPGQLSLAAGVAGVKL